MNMMNRNSFRLWTLVLAVVMTVAPVAAQRQTGSLTGQVVLDDGTEIGGVSVVINELGLAQVADGQGRYRFGNVPPGSYTVTFSLGDRVDVEEGVEVRAGETTELSNTVDWLVSFAETLIVVSASRRAERIVDAPAAISTVSEMEIERDAATGQLPKLLEFTPGVEVTQGGLYDFNLNTRGFNSSLTRRVQVLVDGRDPSTGFLASQEWTAASLPLDDIQSLEMIRGPSAALYGATASSGVVNMVTKAPRSSIGGLVRLTAGELSTRNADFRYATGIGGDWYLKLLGGYREGDTFTVPRVGGMAEYRVPCVGGVVVECLPQEGIPPEPGGVEGWAGSARVDGYLNDSLVLTLEGGNASLEGAVIQTNIARVQISEVDRPWLRVNLNHPRWNLLVARTERDAPRQPALGPGVNLLLDSRRDQAELQANWDFGGRARLVLGGSYKDERVDTFDPNRGIQTLMFTARENEATAAFGQLDWNLNDRLKLVLAGRFDDSDTFYENEFSPKAALVWSVNDRNSLRFLFNKGFQSPAFFELFLQVDAAAPLPLQPFEAFCSPFGVSCGFDQPTRVLAVGNPNLEVEEVESFEIGYSGILANKAFLTIDYYNTKDEDFVSDLISTQFTPLGDFNTVFGPYAPPAALPGAAAAALVGTLQAVLGPSFALLSNNFDGTPILAAASYIGFGQVDTQGVDVGLNYYASPRWTVSANYSWFDFDIKRDVPGLERFLSPNSPENAARAGIAYSGDRFDAALSGRWVDDFFWSTGPFVGTVDSYTTFDLSAGYSFSERFKFSVNVSNLFDDEQYQAFGGDLIARRALASLDVRW